MPFLLQTKTADTHFPESEAAAAEATLPKKKKNKQTNNSCRCLSSFHQINNTKPLFSKPRKQTTHAQTHAYIHTYL
jgi:hypothetical protein